MPVESLRAVREDGYLNVVVETPRGSTIKVKFDPASGLMMLSRPLPSGLSYPFDWGFVAGTRAADGDPLDALVLWDCSSYPGLLVPSRPLAVLTVEQSAPDGVRQRNDRLIVVPGKSPRLDALKSVEDIPARLGAELEQFFKAAVAFEGKQSSCSAGRALKKRAGLSNRRFLSARAAARIDAGVNAPSPNRYLPTVCCDG